MTPTEEIAETWLRDSLGCKSVVFQPRGTPDFITDKGGFEVKIRRAGKFVFHQGQLERIKKANASLIAFNEDGLLIGVLDPYKLTSEDYLEVNLTSLRIDSEIWHDAKVYAAENDIPLKQVLETALRRMLPKK